MTFSRPVAALAVAASALALTACSPALQVDSAEKVDTATHFPATPLPEWDAAATTTATPSAAASSESATLVAAPGTPAFIDQVGVVTRTPVTIQTSYTSNEGQLTGIQWTSWTKTRALGSGTLVDASGNETENVPVRLTAPIPHTSGVEVFSVLEIDGEEVVR